MITKYSDGTNLLGWILVGILFGLAAMGLLFLVLLFLGGRLIA